MATVLQQFDPQQDDQENQSAGQGSNSNLSAPSEAPTIGGSQESGVVTPGGGASTAAPTSSGGTSSGRFNNIRKYLDANKGFKAESGGLAGQIAGNITNQASQVQQNVQKAGQAFNQQAQQNISQYNNPDVVKQALADPNQFAQSADNLAKFSAIRDASYGGPKSLQDLSGEQGLARLQTQAANVSDQVKQGQSEAGRFNLLKNMYGKPTYTAGQQNLDNLLLQSNPEQLKRIQASRQTASNVNRNLQQSEQSAQQQAAQAQAQAAQIQQTTRGLTNQAVQDTQKSVQDQLPAAQAAQQKAAADFANQIKSGYISPEDLARFQAADPRLQSGMELYGANLLPYVQTAGDIRAETIATPEQYQRFQALGKLLGNTANDQASATLSQFSNADLAGKTGPKYNLDVNRALGEIENRKAQYDSQNADIQQAMRASQAALTGGDPNIHWEGGIMGEAGRRANAIRQQLDQQQGMQKADPALAKMLGMPAYQDYSKMSDMDVLGLSGLGGPTQGTGYANPSAAGAMPNPNASQSLQVAGSGSNWDLIQGIKYHQAQQAAQQAKLKQLQDTFKIGHKLTTQQAEADLAATLPETVQNAVLGLPTAAPTFTPTGPNLIGSTGGPIRLR